MAEYHLHYPLSQPAIEVIRDYVTDFSDAEIAELLHTTVKTVKRHRRDLKLFRHRGYYPDPIDIKGINFLEDYVCNPGQSNFYDLAKKHGLSRFKADQYFQRYRSRPQTDDVKVIKLQSKINQ